MTVLNLVLGGTIFTEGGHYSPVNNVLGGQYSLVNNVRGDIFRGDTVHYDNVMNEPRPSALREFRTGSDECAGPGNEATCAAGRVWARDYDFIASFPGLQSPYAVEGLVKLIRRMTSGRRWR